MYVSKMNLYDRQVQKMMNKYKISKIISKLYLRYSVKIFQIY